jgi:hypothetical protein
VIKKPIGELIWVNFWLIKKNLWKKRKKALKDENKSEFDIEKTNYQTFFPMKRSEEKRIELYENYEAINYISFYAT